MVTCKFWLSLTSAGHIHGWISNALVRIAMTVIEFRKHVQNPVSRMFTRREVDPGRKPELITIAFYKQLKIMGMKCAVLKVLLMFLLRTKMMFG